MVKVMIVGVVMVMKSKEKLMDMMENAHTCLETKRKECKELPNELKALKQSFDELQVSLLTVDKHSF